VANNPFFNAMPGKALIHAEATVTPPEGWPEFQKFLDVLTGSADQPLYFRGICDDKAEADRAILNHIAHDCTEWRSAFMEMKAWNAKRYAVFMGINAGAGFKDAEINTVRSIFVDSDESKPEKAAAIREAVLADKPTLLVNTSGHKFHAHWLINDLPVGEFRSIQQALVAKFGTDPAVINPARIMRVPGFLHQKSEPVPVTLEVLDHPPLTAAQVREWLAPELLAQQQQRPRVPARRLSDRDLIMLAEALPFVSVDDYDAWLKVGMALHHSGDPQGLEIWISWSTRSAKYVPGECEQKWQGFDRDDGAVVGLGTIFFLARQGGWLSLRLNAKGKVLPTPDNLEKILLEHPAWREVLGFNAFTNRMEKRTPPPTPDACTGEWLDDDVHRLRVWLNQEYEVDFAATLLFAGADVAARRNPFDPAQENLQRYAAAWDGEERLNTWLSEFLGADRSHGADYLRELGRCWMIGLVARVLRPGCQRDDVLVLQGDQSIGKTTTARLIAAAIATDAYTAALGDLGSDEAKLALQGVVIAELGELAALGRSQLEAVKSFITETADRVRGKYERKYRTIQRTVSFIGTTNADAFLRDATGERRWWPVHLLGPIDRIRLGAAIPQLLGEAVTRLSAGEAWHITNRAALAQAEEVRAECKEEDSWTERVLQAARGELHQRRTMGYEAEVVEFSPQQVTMNYILGILGKFGADQDRGSQMRVSQILRANRWRRVQIRAGADRRWVWLPPNEEDPIQPVTGTPLITETAER
jgi:predicted P-loop ATPase